MERYIFIVRMNHVQKKDIADIYGAAGYTVARYEANN